MVFTEKTRESRNFRLNAGNDSSVLISDIFDITLIFTYLTIKKNSFPKELVSTLPQVTQH